MDITLIIIVFMATAFGLGLVLISVWNALQEDARAQNAEGVGIAPLRRFVSPP